MKYKKDFPLYIGIAIVFFAVGYTFGYSAAVNKFINVGLSFLESQDVIVDKNLLNELIREGMHRLGL